MKKWKRLAAYVVAVFICCITFTHVKTVEAAEKVEGAVYVDPIRDVKGNWKSTTKRQIEVGEIDSIEIEFANGDRLVNEKSSKPKGLEIISVFNDSNGNAFIYIGGKKTGTYTLSFDVVNSVGNKRGTYKIKVQVVNDYSVIRKATFGKQVVEANYTKVKKGVATEVWSRDKKVKGTSGKLKVTLNSQYKLTGIIVVSVNKKGQYTYKKIRNNRKIQLSKGYVNSYRNANGEFKRSPRKETFVAISYKDKFLGDSVTYSITKKRGKKELKAVTKYGDTGEVETKYLSVPRSIVLWQY